MSKKEQEATLLGLQLALKEGKKASAKGEHEKALRAYEEALKAGKWLGRKRETLEASRLLGALLLHFGRFQEAREALSQGIQLGRALKEEKVLLSLLSKRAECALKLGLWGDAGMDFQEAYRLGKRMRKPALLALATYNLGQFYLQTADFEAGRAVFLELRDRAKAEKDGMNEAHGNMALGNVFLKLQAWDEALKHFQAAKEGFMREGALESLLEVSNQEARLCREMGDLGEAEKTYRQAILWAEQGGLLALGGRLALNLGNLLLFWGRMAEGQDLLEAAYAQAKEEGDKDLEQKLELALGGLSQQLGQAKKALSYFQKAKASLKDKGSELGLSLLSMEIQALVQLGHLEGREGLESLILRGLSLSKGRKNELAFFRFSIQKAALFQLRGELAKAEEAYGSALALSPEGQPLSDRFSSLMAFLGLMMERLELEAGKKLLEEARGLLAQMKKESPGRLREALEFEAMSMRLAFLELPSEGNFLALLDLKEAFLGEGRFLDAVKLDISLSEGAWRLGMPSERREKALLESMTWADKGGLRPLYLELKSVLALYEKRDFSYFEGLSREAEGMGLQLLSLRILRRFLEAHLDERGGAFWKREQERLKKKAMALGSRLEWECLDRW